MGHLMSGLCTGAAACLHGCAASYLSCEQVLSCSRPLHQFTEIFMSLCGEVEQLRHRDMGWVSAARSPRLAWAECTASLKSTTKADRGTTMSW